MGQKVVQRSAHIQIARSQVRPMLTAAILFAKQKKDRVMEAADSIEEAFDLMDCKLTLKVEGTILGNLYDFKFTGKELTKAHLEFFSRVATHMVHASTIEFVDIETGELFQLFFDNVKGIRKMIPDNMTWVFAQEAARANT